MALTGQPSPESAAASFDLEGELDSAEPFGGGHINASYLLSYCGSAGVARFLLQRLNDAVFADPPAVMDNICRVTAHIAQKLAVRNTPDAVRRVLTLVPTRAGTSFLRGATGECWRMYRYIENTRIHEAVATAEQAYAAGRAFGEFQHLLADLPAPRLYETIPDFHNTPLRFAALEKAVQADVCARAATVRAEIEFAREQRALAPVLLAAQQAGEMPERVVHNDAKISNVLFDRDSGEAICVTDLDTVMPGSVLYDFGDMVRSMTCVAAEDEPDLARVEVQLPLFEGLAHGYLEAAAEFLTPAERDHLVLAGRLIALEQGVRFLSDYLNGDIYYQTTRPRHNLARCRAQLKLFASLTEHEPQMTDFVRNWSPGKPT
ncbi:MAG: aminoglycoside phosphotransferase family protein [Planctomycetes bacterium]|nr:aminoglycoside phosphotransferase family protein [Planctomycetota bacterium]